jgi:hypothetical protein
MESCYLRATFATLSKFPNRNLWLQLGEVSFDLRKAKLKKERNPVLDSPLGPGSMRVKRDFLRKCIYTSSRHGCKQYSNFSIHVFVLWFWSNEHWTIWPTNQIAGKRNWSLCTFILWLTTVQTLYNYDRAKKCVGWLTADVLWQESTGYYDWSGRGALHYYTVRLHSIHCVMLQ